MLETIQGSATSYTTKLVSHTFIKKKATPPPLDTYGPKLRQATPSRHAHYLDSIV